MGRKIRNKVNDVEEISETETEDEKDIYDEHDEYETMNKISELYKELLKYQQNNNLQIIEYLSPEMFNEFTEYVLQW